MAAPTASSAASRPLLRMAVGDARSSACAAATAYTGGQSDATTCAHTAASAPTAHTALADALAAASVVRVA